MISDAYLGEIRLVGFGFAPEGWMLCQGQQLSISANQALYSLLGDTYGGDGISIFNLPDLQGRVPVGLSGTLPLGRQGGSETVTLQPAALPAHSHANISGTLAVADEAISTSPNGNYPALSTSAQYGHSSPVPMAVDEPRPGIGLAGSSMPHENRQPFMAMNYAICVVGEFPPRS